ncbi:MAG: glycosyltransferase family 39 protein [Dysgonamonadaceae bacterium]|jgi:hypothetical protein|nr:glycosyltransferase family 39 protein [Dysgonamonadaceae bacterium]
MEDSNFLTQTETFLRNHYNLSVFIGILFGVLIRFAGISSFPAGLNQDEASIGYETYSLLQTAADRNGQHLPVHFISWGSGQNVLCAYLSMLFVKIFGLNVFSMRLLNSLLTSLSLLVFFLLLKSALGRKKAFAGLILLCIMPWHIMIARWGFESNIFPAFFLFAVYFLYKGINGKMLFFPISSVFFALSLYAYGTAYLVVPLFLLLVIPYFVRRKKIAFKSFILSAVLFLLFALPVFLFVIINHLDLPPMNLAGITIPRLLENRTTTVFNLTDGFFLFTMAKNFVRLCYVCLLQSDSFLSNVIPGFGTLYYISLPFLLLGIAKILKNKNLRLQPIHFIMLMWLVSSVVLGLCTHVNINRLNIIFIPMIYFVMEGIFAGCDIVKEQYKKLYMKGIAAIYGFYFLLFTGYYFTMYNEKIASDFCVGFDQSLQFCNENFPNDTIDISTQNINMPYIYVCFYNQISPDIFRKTVVYDEGNRNFRAVKSFDKYRFVPACDVVKSGIMIIGRKDFELFRPLIGDKKVETFEEFYVVYEDF